MSVDSRYFEFYGCHVTLKFDACVLDKTMTEETRKSFFDGIDELGCAKPIGIEALDELEARASEYSKEDMQYIEEMLERKNQSKKSS